MKRALPILFILVVAGAAWFFANKTQEPEKDQIASKQTTQEAPSETVNTGQPKNAIRPGQSLDDFDFEGFEDYDHRPATEIYSSADEALEAIQKGAVDYDDFVLEQFTDLGPACGWCEDFYAGIHSRLEQDDLPTDARSYYAEVLAISGDVKNVSSLLEMAKESEGTKADVYSEAIELTMGDDETVSFLSENIQQEDELLQESVVAAITNHGSRLAAETLYKHTIEKGDPDGYYAVGIGLGEVIPEQEALPFLQEVALKRDEYAHLGVKALLNSGLDGLKMVVDVLTNSPDPEFDRKMLRGAVDHVVYEDQVEEYLKSVEQSAKEPLVRDFAREVLEDFQLDFDGEFELEGAGF